MSKQPDNPGRFTLPRQVGEDERNYINERREAVNLGPVGAAIDSSDQSEGDEQSSPEVSPLVSLAISGGGIRSATFSLGILQVLARRNVLPVVDYLCTVSGGGYVGSRLSSLMTIPKPDTSGNTADSNTDGRNSDVVTGGQNFETATDGKSVDAEGDRNKSDSKADRKKDIVNFVVKSTADDTWHKPNFDMGKNMPLGKAHQVQHLRKHGDFLFARQGLFLREVIRAVGTFVASFASSLGLFLTVLLMLVGMLFWYGWSFNGDHVWTEIHRSRQWVGWATAINSISLTWRSFAESAIVGVAAALLARFTSQWWRPVTKNLLRVTSGVRVCFARVLKNRSMADSSEATDQCNSGFVRVLGNGGLLLVIVAIIVSLIRLYVSGWPRLGPWLLLSGGLLAGFGILYLRFTKVTASRGERPDEEAQRHNLWCFAICLIVYCSIPSAISYYMSSAETLQPERTAWDDPIWEFRADDWRSAKTAAGDGSAQVDHRLAADATAMRRLLSPNAVSPTIDHERAEGESPRLRFPNLLRPAAALFGAFCATLGLYVFLTWSQPDGRIGYVTGAVWDRSNRSIFGAMVGICLYAFVTSLFAVALIFVVWWV